MAACCVPSQAFALGRVPWNLCGPYGDGGRWQCMEYRVYRAIRIKIRRCNVVLISDEYRASSLEVIWQIYFGVAAIVSATASQNARCYKFGVYMCVRMA